MTTSRTTEVMAEAELTITDVDEAEGTPFVPVELIERDGQPPRLVGAFALTDTPQEIDNVNEGHFIEKIAPGAFNKTVKESFKSIKVLVSHGKDPSLGATVIGRLNSIKEVGNQVVYDVGLYRSLPPLLMEGLRDGQYGASFRGEAIKNSVEYRPEPSDYNPKGLPEVTRKEIALKDIGPTPMPQYAETTAVVRSISDLEQRQPIERDLYGEPPALAEPEEPDPEEVERETTPEDEPQHSAEEDNNPKEEIPSWQLRR